MWKAKLLAMGLVLFAAQAVQIARADDSDPVDEARRAYSEEDFQTARRIASQEIKRNPGHEEAYVVLADALEKLDKKDEAAEVWDNLKKITRVRERLQRARLGLLRTRGPEMPKHDPGTTWENDPYKVDVGSIPWDRMARDVAGLNVDYKDDIPPANFESENFQIYGCTYETSEVIAGLCERYMDFLLEKYFNAGQDWVLRLPIMVYKDHDDYVSKGKYPEASAGVTRSDRQTGVPILIALYMLDENGNLDRDSIEGTLPHEIVHMVIHEWFGGASIPRWIDEGLARRMEQTRNHYEEAAKIGRDAVAGEYYRFRELFAQEQYPTRGDRTFRFYEQSATIVLFLLEQFGPDAAVAFLETLKEGGDHDAAAAAAMGIPKEGAVEEFEKRWVEWIRGIYARYGKRLEDGDIAQGTALDAGAFNASFAELDTADKVSNLSTIRTESMEPFKDIGGSHRHWSIENGKLVCKLSNGQEIGSLLGIRTDDEAPLVLTCKVRAPEATFDNPTLFGIAMLDHRSDDTGIHVSTVLIDRAPHELKCVVSDDIALYVDGKCTGRFPALGDLNKDIDWPLAFIGHGPLEITDIKTGMIEAFLPVVANANNN